MKPYIVKRGKKPPEEPERDPSIFTVKNREEFEMEIFKKATYFTVAFREPLYRGSQPYWNVTRYDDFLEAARAAAGDQRKLVYAVAEREFNLSVPLARSRWVEFLAVRQKERQGK